MRRVHHFRMELQAYYAVGAHDGHGGVVRICQGPEPRRQFRYLVSVAHPYGHAWRHIGKERVRNVLVQDCMAVLTLLCLDHLAAQLVSQHLHPVADAQYRQAAVVYPQRGKRCAFFINAGGAPGKDDPLWVDLTDVIPVRVGRYYLAVDVALPYSTRNQSAVL